MNTSKTLNKQLLFLILAVFIFISVIVIDYRINGDTYFENTIITENKLEQLLSSREYTDTPIVTELYFDDQPLIYDLDDNTFYCSSIENQDFTTITTGKSLENSLLQVLGIDYINVGYLPDSGQLIQYSHNKISISNLVFTTLPILNISISSETVKELGLDETYYIESYTSAELYLYDNSSDFDGVSRITSSPIKLHARGGTTIGAPQKSYRISLLSDATDHSSKNKVSLLGLREDEDWILYSPYSDYEKVRNVFAMNLWKEMAESNNEWNASPYTEYRFVEVFFNNNYHGLYAIAYPIDKKQFSITDGESLFKKKDWSQTEFSLDLEYTDSGEGDGYYWLPGYSLEYGNVDSFTQLHDLYYTMAYSDDPAAIRDTVDMGNAIDLYLLYQMTQAVDNLYTTNVKNLLVATKKSDVSYGYKLLFAPWDMDQILGNRFVDGEGSHGISSYANSPDYSLPIAWSPVYFLSEKGDKTISSEVSNRYHTLRRTIWSDDHINQLIDIYEADIYGSGAFERTMVRWSDGNYYDIDKQLEDFRNYTIERLHIMDELY